MLFLFGSTPRFSAELSLHVLVLVLRQWPVKPSTSTFRLVVIVSRHSHDTACCMLKPTPLSTRHASWMALNTFLILLRVSFGACVTYSC
jgi:hypothetical protein